MNPLAQRCLRTLIGVLTIAASHLSIAAEVLGHGGNCLDVSGGNTANGTQIQMWQCQAGNHNQDWTFDDGSIVWSGTKKCLDVAGGATGNGTRVQLWDCQTGNQNQRWALDTEFPGKIVWLGGKCLDVSGGGTTSGTKVQTWDCMTENDNQKWIVGSVSAPSPLAQGHLDVILRPQLTGMWCWAASGQMVMEFLGHPVQQCTEANNEFGRSDCCNSPTPASCVSGGWPEFGKYGFTFKRTSSTALTWSQLQQEITASARPIAFSWGWSGGGGHMMVVNGYRTVAGVNYVEVSDPWPPNVGDHKFITYDFYVESAGDHTHWDDFYEIRHP